ncbi:MAG: glucans biosynthesis glucosyltransferase MdoH [Hyphomicrobiaceae bacterium]
MTETSPSWQTVDVPDSGGVSNAAPADDRCNPIVTTPAGIQSIDELRRRRWIVLVLNVVAYAGLMAWAAAILAHGGWNVLDTVLIIAFAIGTPWTVLGFWNAVIGFWVLHASRSPMADVAPFATSMELDAQETITVRTAVLMTLRNEDPGRAIARLRTVKQSIDATGQGDAYGYFVLSDTNIHELAAAEEHLVAEWQRDAGPGARITYRRRDDNAGFKAGNVRDFCENMADGYELMLPLDADSLMTGDAVLRLTRIMQAYPRIGILQSLVVGSPSNSAFARIFQFGMRQGMRTYTMGQAWWVGDCGPFWGHNALVRILPFRERCHLPKLPGKPPLGGEVLSHDQVEATLMRRAGYEVRVLPEEMGSYEDNPPSILEYMRRDVRWCQGNMQYVKLLGTPGLHAMSRFQLVWAILMFLGIPAWTLIIALLPLAGLEAANTAEPFPVALAIGLYITFFAMYLMPKLAGFADVLATKGGTARYGGTFQFVRSAFVELVFSFLQGAVTTIRTTIFMIGLLFGQTVQWGGQARDARRLTAGAAFAELWPQTLFGAFVCGALALIDPALLLWSLPLTAGYLLAVPLAVSTADPAVGRWVQRIGLCAIPEDIAPPPEIAGLNNKTALPPQGGTR